MQTLSVSDRGTNLGRKSALVLSSKMQLQSLVALGIRVFLGLGDQYPLVSYERSVTAITPSWYPAICYALALSVFPDSWLLTRSESQTLVICTLVVVTITCCADGIWNRVRGWLE